MNEVVIESQAASVTPSIKKRLLKGGKWAFTGQIGTSVAGLLSNILLARLLAPDDLGTYFLALSIVITASQFALVGFDKTVVRFVAESMGANNPGRAHKSVNFSFAIVTIGIIAVIVILSLCKDWLTTSVFDSVALEKVFGLVVLWVIPFAFKSLISETFRGFHDIRFSTLFGGLVFSVISSSLFFVALVIYGQTALSNVLNLTIIATLIPALLGGGLLVRKLKPLGSSGNLSRKAMLDMALPMFVMAVSVFGLKQANLWITAIYLPEDQVALFGAAMRLVIMLAMPLSLVNAIIPPLVAELHIQGRRKEMERTLRIVSTYGGIPSAALLIMFIFLGGLVLELVYGDFYREAASALAILSIGQLINVWSGSCGFVLMMTGYHKVITVITIIFGIINVIMALILVPQYGIIGAAIPWATSLAAQNIITVLMAKKSVGIWTHISFAILFDLKLAQILLKSIKGRGT